MCSDYTDRMDALANSIAKLVDGKPLEDVAVACAAVIGDALHDMPPEQRWQARELVIETMEMQIGRKNAVTH
jgi:hypothetical protein